MKKELLVSRKKKSEDTVINVNNELIGSGTPSFVFGPCAVESYEQVAAVAAEIRDKRRPEPYKGKGIKYADEVIRRKVGKTGKK